VSGKHESPSSTNVHLNVGTRALRVVILIGAIVVGALVIKNGFASNPDRTLVPGAGAKATHSASRSPTPKPSRSRQPRIKGVVVRVLNGTDHVGAAASMSQTIMSAGFTTREVGPGPSSNTTAVYYRSDSLPIAQLLQGRFFPNAPLRLAPSSLLTDKDGHPDPGLQIVVIIGTDFFTSPSPSS
jgi:hypothetical protein